MPSCIVIKPGKMAITDKSSYGLAKNTSSTDKFCSLFVSENLQRFEAFGPLYHESQEDRKRKKKRNRKKNIKKQKHKKEKNKNKKDIIQNIK